MRQGRVRHLAWIGALLLAALVGRLFQMQVVQGEHWADEARLSRIEARTVPFRRGRILDRAGRVLAEDRFTFELHCNYREFRRGHPAGQLLEAFRLVPEGARPELDGGLVEVLERGEELGAEALAWTAEQLQTLPSRDRQDLCFYLRGLCGLDAPGISTEVLAWAHGGSGSFAAAFPQAREGMLTRIGEARAALAELERALGPGWPPGTLLAEVEVGRQDLELRIRQLEFDQALGNAVPGISAREARAALAEDGEAGEAVLATLAARWGPDLDAEGLRMLRRALIAVAQEDEEARALRGKLLDHIRAVAPEDLDGVRRRLVLRVHNDRVLRLQRDLGYGPADLLVREAHRFPGLYVQEVPDRIYPLDVAPHLVGRVGAMDEEQLDAYFDARENFHEKARAFYRSEADEREYQEWRHVYLAQVLHPGEARGTSGVERAFDMVLRGERGYVQLLRGGEAGERPQELVFEPPRHGRDVVLTLDVEMQRAAEEAIRLAYADARRALDPDDKRFRDDPRRLAATRAALAPGRERAAIAIIDLQDGGLPVLATLPTYSRDVYQDADAYARIAGDLDAAPLRQRALGGMPNGEQVPYPGSTFKLLVAAAALAEDSSDFLKRFECHRRLEVGNGDFLHCEGAHGSIDMREAVQESCNIYFYLLAEELGYERLHDFAERLGFGRPTGIELVPLKRGEDGGWRPTGADAALEWGANGLASPERKSVQATMRLGIGQTYVWASPLQVARFYAWLATGELPTPRLVREGAGAAPAAPAERPPLLSEAERRRLRGALRDVVEHGTAEDAERPLEHYGVVGKTGTAQVGEDVLVHAWFAGYFPAEAPRYAFAVLCENSGLHGGEIAADALFHLLQSPEAFRLHGKEPFRSADG